MSKGTINKVILIGNLGNDPEVRSTPGDLVVANLSLATSEGWRDRTTGENKERTEWHRVVLYRQLAELARNYLRKGSKVYVEGKIQTRKWQDRDGNDRYTTEIIADQLQMLDGRNSTANYEQGGGHAQPSSNAGGQGGDYSPSSRSPAHGGANQAPPPYPNDVDFNDDVPF